MAEEWALVVRHLALASAIGWATIPLRATARAYAKTPSGMAFMLFAIGLAVYASLQWSTVIWREMTTGLTAAGQVVIAIACVGWALENLWMSGERKTYHLLPILPGAAAVALGASMAVQGTSTYYVYLLFIAVLFTVGLVALLLSTRAVARVYPESVPLVRRMVLALALLVAGGFAALLIPTVVLKIHNLVPEYLILPAIAFHFMLRQGNAEGLETMRTKIIRSRCDLRLLLLLDKEGRPVFTAKRKGVPDGQAAAVLRKGGEIIESLMLSRQNGTVISAGGDSIQAIRGKDHLLLCLFKGRPNDLLRLELLNLLLSFEIGGPGGAFRPGVERLLGLEVSPARAEAVRAAED
jgi:hypothetical protein